MNISLIELLLIGLAFAFYWFIFRRLNRNLRPSSRAANFSVGGRKRREELEKEQMNREERIRQGKVSLRDSILKRRSR